jgi:hypothetical protein
MSFNKDNKDNKDNICPIYNKIKVNQIFSFGKSYYPPMIISSYPPNIITSHIQVSISSHIQYININGRICNIVNSNNITI